MTITHRRITAKRLEFLKGNVVRLIPRNPDDWHPHGVLCGFDAKTYTIETLDHALPRSLSDEPLPNGRLMTLEEPRDEYRDVGLDHATSRDPPWQLTVA